MVNYGVEKEKNINKYINISNQKTPIFRKKFRNIYSFTLILMD